MFAVINIEIAVKMDQKKKITYFNIFYYCYFCDTNKEHDKDLKL